MASNELEALLAARSDGTCIAIFENRLPCSWNIVIKAIAAEFHYATGGLDRDGDQQANIPCSRTDSLRSGDPKGCVVKVRAAMLIQVPGEANPRLMEGELVGKPGDCLIEVDFVLSPKSSVPSSQIGSLTLGDRVKLEVR
jgi:hypothetical protein